MLTIFSIPKPFAGHIGVIQTNAIRSWTLLEPRCQIILFGDESGIAEAADEAGATHVPDVARNEKGVPLLDWAFERTRELSTQPLTCYVNSDIILMDDLLKAAEIVPFDRFLMIGQRMDVTIDEPLDFSSGWRSRLLDRARETGSLHSPFGIDYFLYASDMGHAMPPFAVGRPGWDGWTVFHARKERIPVIDATRAVTVLHQLHDYSHHQEVVGGDWVGPESQANRRLAGDIRRTGFSIIDATWILPKPGVGPVRTLRHVSNAQTAWPVLYPWLKPFRPVNRALVKARDSLVGGKKKEG